MYKYVYGPFFFYYLITPSILRKDGFAIFMFRLKEKKKESCYYFSCMSVYVIRDGVIHACT